MRATTSLPRAIAGSVALVGLAFVALFLAAPGLAEPPRRIEDEILVGLRRGADSSGAAELVRKSGGAVIREIPAIGVLQLRVPPRAMEAVTRALARRLDVAFVEPNRALPPGAVPNDPDYAAQWHLPHIEAPGAWDVATGAGVVIAVLDSGIDAGHPELGPKMVPGYDATGGGTTDDVAGHGTAVAGSAAAFGNNGVGIASPAWHAALMSVRVAGPDGWASVAAIADGLVWAADRGARIMNLSFWYVADSATIVSAARYAFDHGALVVAAAGNCGCREATRETPYILSVSSTDPADAVSSFSSGGDFIDLAAPGVGIYTTARGGGYRFASGTSLASPVVAGVAALLFSVDPGLSPGEVEAILESTAEDFGPRGWDPGYGHGRVNALRAVLEAAGPLPDPGPEDVTAPEVHIEEPADGTVVSGVVEVLATASDDTGVAGVELYVDGALAARDTEAPYRFSWDTSAVADGPHALEAEAFDEAANAGRSAVVTVAVENARDASPPTVIILAPKDGSRVRGRLRADVFASDDRRVESVELLVDGQPIGSQRCGYPSCTLRFSSKLARGRHRLVGRARDASGNEATSPAVEVIR